jgi:hypothetical protein
LLVLGVVPVACTEGVALEATGEDERSSKARAGSVSSVVVDPGDGGGQGQRPPDPSDEQPPPPGQLSTRG